MLKNITNIWKDPKERQAYSYILSLTFPMIIQNLFNAAVSSADVLMLNSVGQSAISATSLATQYSNILQNIFWNRNKIYFKSLKKNLTIKILFEYIFNRVM